MDPHTYEELLTQRSSVHGKMSALLGTADAGRRDLSAAEATAYDDLEREYDSLTRQIKAAEVTRSGHPLPALEERSVHRAGSPTRSARLSPDQDAALRVVEERSGVLSAAASDHLDATIRRDKFGSDARYISAVSSPGYLRGFMKKLLAVDGAEGILSPDEAEAMRAVGDVMQERALAVGEGATGGYAIPLDLDPTINLVNDGAVNPIRELADVKTISHSKWQGVNSAGVGFEFDGEADEAPDKTPVLTQPEIVPEKASAFVPYSIEADADWDQLYYELVNLFADAKSVKEAEVFAVGSGTEKVPQGLVTGASKTVTTATKEVMASGDVYALQEALAPRYQPRAVWLGANKVANQIHKMVAVGDTEEAPLMAPDRSAILGKSYREVSTMSAKTTTGNEKVLLYGDVKAAYKIVDRLGMTAEIVPHLFGEHGRPTGQRGLYVYFRVGAKVIVPDAVQALKIKAS